MRSRADKSECSESEAFVGTRGHRADGETFDSEREGGFRGSLQGGASGGKPQVSHNRPLACPARRARGIITEGIKPSGKMLEAPPGCPRRFFFSSPPGGRRGQLQKESSQAEKRLKALQAARVAFSSLPRPEGAGDRDGTSTAKRNFGSFGYGVLLSIAQNIFKARQAGRRGVSVNIKYVFQ